MSIGASPSLKTIADLIGDIAPHSMSEMYGIIFADGSSSPASGTISLSSFRNKNFDTTAPVITLANGDEGTTNYTVERGTTYVDPGASTDTGETVTVDTSELNMAVPETYTVTYSATDADGNIGTASRTVIVDDTIAPVITLSGDNPYIVDTGSTYVDPGATTDTGETVTVNTSGLNMAISGTYTVTYSATDADDNIGTASRLVRVTPWPQQAKLLASDAQTQDQFGGSIAVSGDGNTLIVGAPYEDSPDSGVGAAYIFTRSATGWSEQQKIQASVKHASDFFGHCVSISEDGNTVIVGAHLNDDGGTDSGSAYIFTWSGTTWSEQQKIQASDKLGGDYFGYAVAISSDGNTAIVGAYRANGGTGAAYIFTHSGTDWSEQAKIQSANPQANAYFGGVISISNDGNTVIVSENARDILRYDGRTLVDSGAAYIFTRSGTDWSQAELLRAGLYDPSAYDYFGSSVSISGDGNTAIVGAYRDNSRTGAAYIFTRSGTSWSEQAKIVGANMASQPYFGYTVSISDDGNTVVVAAYADFNDTGYVRSGTAYIFTRSGTSWSQEEKLYPMFVTNDQYFSIVSISGDGNTIAVGAYGENSYTGTVYIFTTTT